MFSSETSWFVTRFVTKVRAGTPSGGGSESSRAGFLNLIKIEDRIRCLSHSLDASDLLVKVGRPGQNRQVTLSVMASIFVHSVVNRSRKVRTHDARCCPRVAEVARTWVATMDIAHRIGLHVLVSTFVFDLHIVLRDLLRSRRLNRPPLHSPCRELLLALFNHLGCPVLELRKELLLLQHGLGVTLRLGVFWDWGSPRFLSKHLLLYDELS